MPFTLKVPSDSIPPPPERARRILVVDDDDERRRMLTRLLMHEGYEVDTLSDGQRLLDYVRERPPDLILLDLLLPHVSGFELCADLRMIEDMALTPIILITSAFIDEESVVRGLMCGADDYLVTPTRLAELRARVRVQLRNRRDRELLEWAKNQRASLKNAALCDPLTGLSNRRAIDRVMTDFLQGIDPVLVILLDLDGFKQVNDTYGHAAGDQVLLEVGRVLNLRVRAGDVAARYGGEEFAILVRGAKLDTADGIGERYRHAIRDIVFPPGLGPTRITVSIGVSGCEGKFPRLSKEQLFAAADAALYEAKRGGRDRVVVARPEFYQPMQITGVLK